MAGEDRPIPRSLPNEITLLFNAAATGIAFPIAEEVLTRVPELFGVLLSGWDPDVVTLDSKSWRARTRGMTSATPFAVMPGTGYVSWYSDRVTADIENFASEGGSRLGGGTLISIDFDAADAVGQVAAIADRLRVGRHLRGLPQ